MKKFFVSITINFACLGVIFLLIGLLLSITNPFENKQSDNIESFYWSFYTKPIDLIAQVKIVKVETTNKQASENSVNQVESLNFSNPSEAQQPSESDSISVKEDTDTTKNTSTDDELIHQVLKMNGCFDICNDFVEKDWMKDHSFIIL